MWFSSYQIAKGSKYDIAYHLNMVEFGFSEMLSIGQTIGIIGTMVLALYFSKRQIQNMSIDQQSTVLNDLDEKVRKMAEIIIGKPSTQKVIYKLDTPLVISQLKSLLRT